MEKDIALRILEAILLASKRPVKKTTLTRYFEGFDLKYLIKLANQKLKETGFFIHETDNSLELVTKPELAPYLINFFDFEENKNVEEFLIVLAIIAYGGPITLKEINRLHGKKSLVILKQLLNQGLIKKEKKHYKVTKKFLNILGFNNVKELPNYQSLRKNLLEK